VALVSLALASAPLRCGTVNELGEDKTLDIDVQASLNKISASWAGFEDGWEKNRVLRYEWCIISSSVARSQQIQDRECRTSAGFLGHPDVYGWVNAERSTSASASNLRLKNGETYYVVVRATTALGTQKYTNSDGIRVDTAHVAARQERSTGVNVKRSESIPSFPQSTLTCGTTECPINEEWRCPAGDEGGVDSFYFKRPSVREYLEQFYGPPQFLVENSAIAPFRIGPVVVDITDKDNDDDGADDEDDLSDGDVIGIAIGITAFFCFIVIGVILVASLFGNNDKFDTNVRRHDNVEEF
jgi:hypothetical protein